MTAYLLCEICREAGLPNGVLNIVHGTGPNVGAADHRASEDRHDLVHRRHRDRPQSGRSLRADVQESLARAGRKESEHRFRRRRSGCRHRRQRALFVRQPGPGLSLRFARFCRAIGLPEFVDRFIEKASQAESGRSARDEDRPGRDRVARRSSKGEVLRRSGAAGGREDCARRRRRRRRINERCQSRLFFPADRHHRFAGRRAAPTAKKSSARSSRSRRSTAKKK